MNRLILIGNGFDLAHGLPTSYRDFINDHWNSIIDDIRDSKYQVHDGCVMRRSKERTSTTIHPSLLDTIDENAPYDSLMNHFKACNYSFIHDNSFLQEISDKSLVSNWVDIEEEYYKVLKSMANTKNTSGLCVLNESFEDVKSKLITYLSKIKAEEAISNRSIFEKIYEPINKKELLIGEPELIRTLRENKVDSIFPKETLLLSFNYTHTINHYLPEVGKNLFYKHKNITKIPGFVSLDTNVIVSHIHGDLNSDIIFGYGDELDRNYKDIENLNDNDYLENVKSIKYLERKEYQEMLKFIDSAKFQVFIFGHSCGISDRTLLNTIFEHKNCLSIKPFYYIDEHKKDNYSAIVRNISRNFRNKSAMRKKVVNKEYCETLV